MQRITILGEPSGTEVDVLRELRALDEEEQAWEMEHQLFIEGMNACEAGASARRKTSGPSLV